MGFLSLRIKSSALAALPRLLPQGSPVGSTFGGYNTSFPNSLQYKPLGSYVVDGVLMGDKSLISNEEQILKKFTRF